MPPTPKYSRLDPSERREQILDAANALFAERAYDEVSVEDIAGAAGVARGLVHHYFGGRKEVYIALLERLGAVRQAERHARRGRRRARVPRHHGLSRAARHDRAACAPYRLNVFIPFTIGGGIRSAADAQAVLDAGADKVSVNSAAVRAPGAAGRSWPTCSAPSAWCWPSMGSGPRRRLRGFRERRPGRPPAATWSSGPARAPSGARARSCLRAWTATEPRTATTST